MGPTLVIQLVKLSHIWVNMRCQRAHIILNFLYRDLNLQKIDTIIWLCDLEAPFCSLSSEEPCFIMFCRFIGVLNQFSSMYIWTKYVCASLSLISTKRRIFHINWLKGQKMSGMDEVKSQVDISTAEESQKPMPSSQQEVVLIDVHLFCYFSINVQQYCWTFSSYRRQSLKRSMEVWCPRNLHWFLRYWGNLHIHFP